MVQGREMGNRRLRELASLHLYERARVHATLQGTSAPLANTLHFVQIRGQLQVKLLQMLIQRNPGVLAYPRGNC